MEVARINYRLLLPRAVRGAPDGLVGVRAGLRRPGFDHLVRLGNGIVPIGALECAVGSVVKVLLVLTIAQGTLLVTDIHK